MSNLCSISTFETPHQDCYQNNYIQSQCLDNMTHSYPPVCPNNFWPVCEVPCASDWKQRSVGADPEFLNHQKFAQVQDEGPPDPVEGFNITTRLKPRKQTLDCGNLEFLFREIPGPQWNSTYCLETIVTVLKLPNVERMEPFVHEIWHFYLTKSPNGVLLQDFTTLAQVILAAYREFTKMENAMGLFCKIFTHLKNGLRIRNASENNDICGLRTAFDTYAEVIEATRDDVRAGALEILLRWCNMYAAGSNQTQSIAVYKPKCYPWAPCFKTTGCVPTTKQSQKKRAPTAVAKQKNPCIQNNGSGDATDGLLSGSSFFGALENSNLPLVLEGIVCQECADENDIHYIILLQILRRLCENSYCIRSCVINSSVLEYALRSLSSPDPSKLILGSTIDLIFAIVTPASSVDVKDIQLIVVPTPEAFESLLSRFLDAMSPTHVIDKSLRNHLACVTFALSQHCRPVRQMFGKHLKDIAGVLSNNILTGDHFHLVLTSSKDDLVLVQYLIWILELVIPSKEEYYEIIESYQLVPVMVRLLIGPCPILDENKTDPQTVETIMKSAWRALTAFVPLQPAQFLQNEGAGIMFTTLSLYAQTGQAAEMVVEAFLDVLRLLLTHTCAHEPGASDSLDINDSIIRYFNSCDAMDTFTELVRSITSADNFCVSMEPLLCRALLCCSELGKHDDMQKEIFRTAKGVKVIIRLTHQLLYTPAHVRHMNPWLHIVVADCIRNCIADYPMSLEIFLLHEGMFRILDLIEVSCSPPAQVHLLAALIDLCNYSRCADQMMYWRRNLRLLAGSRLSHDDEFNLPKALMHSKGLNTGRSRAEDVYRSHTVEEKDLDQTLSALLCKLWRQEERQFGVLRDEYGIIASLRYPLMTEYARKYERKYDPKQPLPPDAVGPASLDMMGKMRPKIALLVKIMTEESNTETAAFGGLSLKNQITMQVILNYIDLKMAEAYAELRDEISAEETPLAQSDRDALDTLVATYRNKVSAVIHTQRYLIQRTKEEAVVNERELYSKIRTCQLQDTLNVLREAQYLGTMSNYFLLVDKKLWQNAQLQDVFKAMPAKPEDFQLSRRRKQVTIHDYGEHQGEGSDEGEGRPPFGYSFAMDTLPSIDHSPVRMLLPSRYASPSDSQTSVEEGVYMVPPEALHKALTKALAEVKYWSEKEQNADEDMQWLMRKKWAADWYPLRFNKEKPLEFGSFVH